ncbi:caspase family protein [Micromonospora sp. NPDC047738]|uniref:caspase family protein n=1 Tax=Micromonospora sp. NPDC047738 TaxID=3155741 RepID=UPI0033D77849
MTTAAYLPDPARSRAVLIGVSAYTRMPAIPAAAANVAALSAVLTDADRWGLPAENCRLVVDPVTAQDILDPIHEAAAEATDALVVYFAGHGLLDNGELELALVGGAANALHHAVRFAQVRREVVTTARRCRAKVVILDCCFSGRAMSGFMAAPGPLADHAVIDGTYLMTATAETTLALAPPGNRYTAFTAALLSALENGVPGGPDPLDMDTLFHQVESELRSRGQPIPQRRSRNGGNRIALVRNPATGALAETPARTYEQPRRRRILPWSVAAGLVVAAAGLASAFALDLDPRRPQVIGSTPPGVSAGPATSSRTPEAPTMTSTTLPRTQKVTASWRRDVPTTDGSVVIGLTGVNQDGIFFYVVTPEISCSVKGSQIGESIVVPQRDGVWIRFVLLKRLYPNVNANNEDFDTPVEFQVQWGRDKAPRSSRPCQ